MKQPIQDGATEWKLNRLERLDLRQDLYKYTNPALSTAVYHLELQLFFINRSTFSGGSHLDVCHRLIWLWKTLV